LIGICETLLQRACKKPHGQTELSRLSWLHLKAGHVNGDVKWLSALLNRIPNAKTKGCGIDFFYVSLFGIATDGSKLYITAVLLGLLGIVTQQNKSGIFRSGKTR